MKVVALKCPNCGARLEKKDDIDMYYCICCDYTTILDGQSKESVNAKVRLKQMEHEERLKGKEFAQQRYKIEHRAKESRRGAFGRILMVIASIVFFAFMFGSPYFHSVQQEKNLQKIVEAIEADIANGDYDSAFIKANSLYYDANWSSEIKEKWDNIRTALLETIESKTKSQVPESAKKLKGKNYQEVLAELKAAGFTNITTTELTDLVKGWLTKDGEVEKVSINGISDFKAGDSFPKDAEIIIIYHTFPK